MQIAKAFGVTPEAVRHWRGWFSERGVDALRSALAVGQRWVSALISAIERWKG